jgi:hypothetical protein
MPLVIGNMLITQSMLRQQREDQENQSSQSNTDDHPLIEEVNDPYLHEIVKENDRMFHEWETGAKGADAKLPDQQSPPQEQVMQPSMQEVRERPYPDDFDQEQDDNGKSDGSNTGQAWHDDPLANQTFRSKPGLRPYRKRKRNYVLGMRPDMFIFVTILIGMVAFMGYTFLWNPFGSITTAARHGAYDDHGPIFVVDNVTGEDVSSQVATFGIYVTNDTADYDSYFYIQDTLSIPGIYFVFTNYIPHDLYYKFVVLYTEGIAPYGYSWDIITTEPNYIYLGTT